MSDSKIPYLLMDVAELELQPVATQDPARRKLEPVTVSFVVDATKEDSERMFWVGMRQMLLGQLDLIERKLGVSPRTSELRKRRKDAKIKG